MRGRCDHGVVDGHNNEHQPSHASAGALPHNKHLLSNQLRSARYLSWRRPPVCVVRTASCHAVVRGASSLITVLAVALAGGTTYSGVAYEVRAAKLCHMIARLETRTAVACPWRWVQPDLLATQCCIFHAFPSQAGIATYDVHAHTAESHTSTSHRRAKRGWFVEPVPSAPIAVSRVAHMCTSYA